VDRTGVLEGLSIRGLNQGGQFDGALITFDPLKPTQPSVVWEKQGLRRWDVWLKACLLLAAVGTVIVAVAAAFHPGITTECGPEVTRSTALLRAPVKAVFLLDASGSVSDAMWEAEQQATVAIIQAFEEVYASEKDRLHLGVAQFSTDASWEVGLSVDHDAVKAAVLRMEQDSGGTQFAKALSLCSSKLAGYSTDAGAFEVCVLVTDGEAQESPDELDGILSSDTTLMGIYVGDSAASGEKLREITSCGGQDCRFYASASNFAELSAKATDVAQAVTQGLEESKTTEYFVYHCEGEPWWTVWALLGVVPAVLWWVYLHTPRPGVPWCCQPHKHQDPIRLRSAGGPERV